MVRSQPIHRTARRGRAVAIALRLLAPAAALSAVAIHAAPARADEAPKSAPIAPANEKPKSAPIALVLSYLPWNVDAAALRDAIARELGASVAIADKAPAGQSSLTVRSGEGRAVILSYHDVDGRITEASIELSDSADRAVQVLALLAGNVVRDESAELAAALRKRPDAPPLASTPSAAPAPPTSSPSAPPSPEGGASPDPGATSPPAPASGAPEDPGSIAAADPDTNPPRSSPAAHPAPDRRARCSAEGAVHLPAAIDFAPMIGTSSAFGLDTTRGFAINIMGGYSAGLRGVELGGLFNVESAFVCGLQIASAVNVSLGPVYGVQMAGGINIARRLGGAQLAPVNITTEAHGAQIGFIDVSAGEMRGAQWGVLNIVTGDVRGTQIGFLNIATGKVHGAQLGFINIADDSSFSFGFVNAIRRGPLHLDAWGQESGIVMIGLKNGTEHFHNIYGVGARMAGDKAGWAFTLGMGGHVAFSRRFAADLDGLVYSLSPARSVVPYALVTQARLLLGVTITRGFGVYLGPSYNIALAKKAEDAKLSPYGYTLFTSNADTAVSAWPGIVAGVQVL